MSEKAEEWLIVLRESTEEVRAQLKAYGRVTQTVSPRVLVLGDLADRCAPDLAATEGVAAVTDGALPPEVFDQLDEKEALWAAAWAQRKRSKNRLGEGLDWDAEGFEPPGPPQVKPLPEDD